jgi:putative endonuclease
MPPKRIVYILRSVSTQSRPYVGLTSDVRSRLDDHNAGRCPHTARYRPWQLHATIELSDEERAVAFERYLKSGSGAPSQSATSAETLPISRPGAGEAATTGVAAYEGAECEIWVRTLLGRRAGHATGQHGLDSVEQVLRNQRLEVTTLRAHAVFGYVHDARVEAIAPQHSDRG